MTKPIKAEFYTAEEYAAAKQINAAAFLMSIGYELIRSGNCYKGKLHNSLVIRDDGRWYWNSRQLNGSSPIELYKHILLNDYGYADEITAAITAVKQLAGGTGACTGLTYEKPVPQPGASGEPLRLLQLPAPYMNNNRVMAYLCKTRGLDPEIVRGLINNRKVYETVQSWDREKHCYVNTPFHNTVFVACNKDGEPKNASGSAPKSQRTTPNGLCAKLIKTARPSGICQTLSCLSQKMSKALIISAEGWKARRLPCGAGYACCPACKSRRIRPFRLFMSWMKTSETFQGGMYRYQHLWAECRLPVPGFQIATATISRKTARAV